MSAEQHLAFGQRQQAEILNHGGQGRGAALQHDDVAGFQRQFTQSLADALAVAAERDQVDGVVVG